DQPRQRCWAARRRPSHSLPMIWVARQDGHRTIKLLGEHDADELVRPGHGAEGEAEVGTRKHRLAEPIGTAYCHDDLAFAAIAPAAQAFGEAGAAERRAALVEGHE